MEKRAIRGHASQVMVEATGRVRRQVCIQQLRLTRGIVLRHIARPPGHPRHPGAARRFRDRNGGRIYPGKRRPWSHGRSPRSRSCPEHGAAHQRLVGRPSGRGDNLRRGHRQLRGQDKPRPQPQLRAYVHRRAHDQGKLDGRRTAGSSRRHRASAAGCSHAPGWPRTSRRLRQYARSCAGGYRDNRGRNTGGQGGIPVRRRHGARRARAARGRASAHIRGRRHLEERSRGRRYTDSRDLRMLRSPPA